MQIKRNGSQEGRHAPAVLGHGEGRAAGPEGAEWVQPGCAEEEDRGATSKPSDWLGEGAIDTAAQPREERQACEGVLPSSGPGLVDIQPVGGRMSACTALLWSIAAARSGLARRAQALLELRNWATQQLCTAAAPVGSSWCWTALCAYYHPADVSESSFVSKAMLSRK